MDNTKETQQQQQVAQLQNFITGAVHHELEHFIDSPQLINRIVGESMRHMGATLENSSVPYLPIQPEEVLVKPLKALAKSEAAIVLIRRALHTETSFKVLGTGTKQLDGSIAVSFIAFTEDKFNLFQTKFYNFPAEVTAEISRQLKELIGPEGGQILVQGVEITHYFREAPKPAEDNLFNTDVSAAPAPAVAPAPAPAATQSSGGLPPVSHGQLL